LTDPERIPTNREPRLDRGEPTSQRRNSLLNGFFVLGVALFFAGGLVALPRWMHAPVAQPIQFNHLKHKQAGLGCADCHATVLDQAAAGLPDLALCLTCHEAAVTESKEEEKIRTIASGGGELTWNQVTRMPEDVYFSHRRHAKLAKLDCLVCHGTVGESVRPPERPALPMMMANCLDCHKKTHANVDCYACHR